MANRPLFNGKAMVSVHDSSIGAVADYHSCVSTVTVAQADINLRTVAGGNLNFQVNQVNTIDIKFKWTDTATGLLDPTQYQVIIKDPQGNIEFDSGIISVPAVNQEAQPFGAPVSLNHAGTREIYLMVRRFVAGVLIVSLVGANGAFKASRKWQISKQSGPIDNGVKTGKTAVTDDATSRNRGQTLHFDGFISNVRGELLGSSTVNWGIRQAANESNWDEANDTVALSSGRFQDNYSVDTDEVAGTKALVIADVATATTNQTRTGVDGTGNFVESDTGSPEWSVSSAYTVETRTQRESTRNADPEDTDFMFSEGNIYHFVNVLDSSGDVVVGARLDEEQLDPTGLQRELFSDIITGSDGWTPVKVFEVRAPKGTGWKQRSTITSHAANNGNTGTNDQDITIVSAVQDREIAIFTNHDLLIGKQTTIYVDYRKSDGTRLDFDSAPSVRIYKIGADGSDVQQMALTAMTQFSGQLSWSVNWTPTNSGTHIVEVRGNILGVGAEGVTNIFVHGGSDADKLVTFWRICLNCSLAEGWPHVLTSIGDVESHVTTYPGHLIAKIDNAE